MSKFNYSLTLRKTKFPVFIKDYDDWFREFTRRYPEATVEYHYEATNGLHAHASIGTNRRIYINRIHTGEGWNIDFHPTNNIENWLKYIRKDIPDEVNLINEEYQTYNDYIQHTTRIQL